MYASFYRLTKEPFHITPDPEFLFMSPSHREALGSIIYGVEQGKGFIVITGEVGVGKTTVLRSYLEKVDKQHLNIIYIFNSNISFKGLLDTIYQELDLDLNTDDVVKMVNHLHHVTVREYEEGQKLVIIIDEAQNMPVKTLENLRMLSNLETSTDKLIQIVMVGQPEFEQILKQKELRQLKQRVALHCFITPFSREESLDYIKYRLGKVAAKNTPVFTSGAMKKIVKQAKGIPRTINILCDNALITGFGYQKKPVTSKIVKEVIADFEDERKTSFWKWLFAPVAALFVGVVLFGISPYNRILFPDLAKDFSHVTTTVPLYKISSERNTDFPGSKQEEVKSPKQEEVKSKVEIHTIPAPEENEVVAKNIETSLTNQIPATRDNAPVPTFSVENESPAQPKFPLTRIVKEGDNLYRLTQDVYGFADDGVIKRVREKNPSLKDINMIFIGDRILFPKLDDRK